MTEFDKFSPNYTDILDLDVKFSGEKSEYFANYKAECVKRSLGGGFGGRILDYGCGIGLVSKCLRRGFPGLSVEIVGYDISRESVKEAGRDSKNVMFTDNAACLAERSFDAIIMANVLHHVKPAERPAFLKKASMLLKEGGYVFIFEHNPLNPVTRMIVKASVLDKGVELVGSGETGRLLRDAGLEILDKKYILFFPRLLKALRFMEPVLAFLPVGAQYVCVGRRGCGGT